MEEKWYYTSQDLKRPRQNLESSHLTGKSSVHIFCIYILIKMKNVLNAKYIEINHKVHQLNCLTKLVVEDKVKAAGLVSVS